MTYPLELAQAAGFAIGGAAFLIIALLIVLTSIFWIWMLIDCLSSPLPPMEKLVWVIVMLFLHFVGALIYFVVARSGARR
jgi:uncharacterized membrane protein